jgi:hypothetical protein
VPSEQEAASLVVVTTSHPVTPLLPDDGPAAAPPAAPAAVAPVAPVADPDAAITRAFSTSVVVSAIRCLLTYVLFPWVLPLLGVAKGVGPWIGLTVGVVAIGFNIASIRRFVRSGHRYRYWVSSLNVVVIAMLVVLIVRDVGELLG